MQWATSLAVWDHAWLTQLQLLLSCLVQETSIRQIACHVVAAQKETKSAMTIVNADLI